MEWCCKMMSAVFQEDNEVCVVLGENDYINIMPISDVNTRYIARNKGGRIVIDEIKKVVLKTDLTPSDE